jgi:hypothetical protein
MAEITNELLKQAIADAEAVRQTAIANAKIALEETFTPQIKSMLARRLRAEAYEEEDEGKMKDEGMKKMEDEGSMKDEGSAKETPFQDATHVAAPKSPQGTSAIGGTDNKEPSADSWDSSDIDQGGEGEKDSHTDWYDDWSEKDFDLDEVIKELEEDIKSLSESDEEEDESMKTEAHHEEEGEEEGEGEENDEEDEGIVDPTDKAHTPPSAGMKKTATMQQHGIGKSPAREEDDEAVMAPSAANGHKYGDPKLKMDAMHMGMDKGHGHEEGEGEEELDLEAILRELEADGQHDAMQHPDQDDAMQHPDASTIAAKMEALKNELAEYREVVNVLRGKLQEVNLLNAKLLYTNRIFRQEGLTNEQKVRILESFDRAVNVREVKMVYTTLVETLTVAAKTFKSRATSSKVVTEGLASKPTASTAPKKEILEENTVAKRLQQLAGIL